MKNVITILISLLFLGISTAYGGMVEKCVDSTGKITYTDKGCKGKETAQDSYLTNAQNKGQKYGKTEATTVSFRVSEIGILTEQASKQCASHAIKYFADKHAESGKNATSEFLKIKDRSIKGAGVKIVMEGVVRFKNKNKPQEMKVLCTASKTRDTDWALAFKDAGPNEKQDMKNAQN
jgi:hypothetical protein